MSHKLEIDRIQLEFNERKILADIYLKCETGKIAGLLGKNGAGKSCLMQIIYGSMKCEKSVRFDNVGEYEAFKRNDLLRYLPQFNFIPKQLSLNKIFNDFELDYSVFTKIFTEFTGWQKEKINKLSGGERRLIELYMIVKSTSQFVMLDEPFTHLNPLQIEKAKQLLIEEKVNKGFLITDHMFKHIIDIADNLYVLANGKTHLIKGVEEVERLGYARMT